MHHKLGCEVYLQALLTVLMEAMQQVMSLFSQFLGLYDARTIKCGEQPMGKASALT